MNAFERKHFTVLLHKVVLFFQYVNEQSVPLPEEF